MADEEQESSEDLKASTKGHTAQGPLMMHTQEAGSAGTPPAHLLVIEASNSAPAPDRKPSCRALICQPEPEPCQSPVIILPYHQPSMSTDTEHPTSNSEKDATAAQRGGHTEPHELLAHRLAMLASGGSQQAELAPDVTAQDITAASQSSEAEGSSPPVEPCPDGTGVDARGSGVEEKEAGTEPAAKPVDGEARRASDQAVVAEGAVGQGGERDGGANVTELLMRTAGRAHLLKPLEAATLTYPQGMTGRGSDPLKSTTPFKPSPSPSSSLRKSHPSPSASPSSTLRHSQKVSPSSSPSSTLRQTPVPRLTIPDQPTPEEAQPSRAAAFPGGGGKQWERPVQKFQPPSALTDVDAKELEAILGGDTTAGGPQGDTKLERAGTRKGLSPTPGEKDKTARERSSPNNASSSNNATTKLSLSPKASRPMGSSPTTGTPNNRAQAPDPLIPDKDKAAAPPAVLEAPANNGPTSGPRRSLLIDTDQRIADASYPSKPADTPTVPTTASSPVPTHRPSATPQAGEQLLKSITSPLSSMAARLFRHSAVVVSSSSEAQAQAGHNIAATYPHPATPSLPALEHAASPKPSKPLTPTQGLGGLSQLRESLRSTGKQALAAVKAPGRLHLMPRRSSSLQQLVRRGDMAALALELENSPHCLEAKDIDRRTPLHVAAEEGSVQALRLLLVAGADASVRDRRQTDPLFVASGRGHKEVVELLIDMGKAGVNSRCFAARTALHEAAAHGHTSVVQALLQRGADANAVDTQGVSPLMAAASEGYFESCQQLVSGGANVNSADFDGLTPLMVAAFEDKRYVVQLLIEAGAHLDAANRNGHTALHLAYAAGNVEVGTVLVRAGASKRAKDLKGLKPTDLLPPQAQQLVGFSVFGGPLIGDNAARRKAGLEAYNRRRSV